MEIQKVRQKHEAIMDFMIANPTAKQGEIAQEFGLTQAWLSIIINSDAFKQRLAEKNSEVFNEVVLPLREKLEGVAHRAVEKLGKAVDDTQDPKLILEMADKTLHRLGYAPSKGPTAPAGQQGNVTLQQNNFYTANPEDLARAREAMDALRNQSKEAEALEGEVVIPELSTPEGV